MLLCSFQGRLSLPCCFSDHPVPEQGSQNTASSNLPRWQSGPVCTKVTPETTAASRAFSALSLSVSRR